MFWRILRKSITKRKSRIAIAIISVLMGASIATALLSVSMDVSEKVGFEFRKYGANLMVVPKSDIIEVGFPGVDFGAVTDQRYINESDLWKIKSIFWRNNVLGFAPLLYQVVEIGDGENNQNVVLAGTYFNKDIEIIEPYSTYDDPIFNTGIKVISPWWNVNGSWIENSSDNKSSMVGINVAEKIGLKIGDTYTISFIRDYEDQTNLPVVQNITGLSGKVHTVQVSALCNNCPVDTFAYEIQGAIPYVDARTVKQLVSAEMNILGKIEDMMFLVTIVALLASALGVMTTMTTSVIERKKEIGLMKSVGAENKKIVALFLGEATIIGIAGGILGYIIGFVLSQFIGMSVFNTTISSRIEVLPIAIGISVGVSLLASILPVRRATKVEPAIVLRGE